ncbi:hypothetical protein D3C78_1364360 [compost metagenome]
MPAKAFALPAFTSFGPGVPLAPTEHSHVKREPCPRLVIRSRAWPAPTTALAYRLPLPPPQTMVWAET